MPIRLWPKDYVKKDHISQGRKYYYVMLQETREVFHMFTNDKILVVILLCDNEVMNFIIDKFGMDAETETVSNEQFQVKVNVCTGPTFYRWIFGYGGEILIKSPIAVREEYKAMLNKSLDNY